MDFNRIHDHLLVVMAEDIKTGFDFAAGKAKTNQCDKLQRGSVSALRTGREY
jgi:hypothetical protein